jgi:hypothetical protein
MPFPEGGGETVAVWALPVGIADRISDVDGARSHGGRSAGGTRSARGLQGLAPVRALLLLADPLAGRHAAGDAPREACDPSP